MLADGIRKGNSYTAIGKALGKSEKAVRGKVYFVYLTENQDKVRAMLKDKPWGYGAPDPTVKQAVHLSRTRTETVQTLECSAQCSASASTTLTITILAAAVMRKLG